MSFFNGSHSRFPILLGKDSKNLYVYFFLIIVFSKLSQGDKEGIEPICHFSDGFLRLHLEELIFINM